MEEEEEISKIRTNNKTQVILKAADFVTFMEWLRIRRYGHDEMVDKGRMRNPYGRL